MRKNGWYRVWADTGEPELMRWRDNVWIVDDFDGCTTYFRDRELGEIDPQMVMTPNGEIVYHTAQHDPLYNTAQEQ